MYVCMYACMSMHTSKYIESEEKQESVADKVGKTQACVWAKKKKEKELQNSRGDRETERRARARARARAWRKCCILN